MAKKIRFEDTINRLEAIVSSLDNEEIDLEESLKAFEEGMKLAQNAQDMLNQAEQRISVLVEQNGEPVAQTFDQEPEG